MSYHTSIEQQLSAIESEDKGRSRKNILILGAGMAGLAAGYELAQRGHRVQIYEASSRLGGRIWTHRFKNGQYGEFGAMRIPASHDYSRYYVNKFQLGLRKFINTTLESFRDFEGTLCTGNDAPLKIADLFNLSRRDREAILNQRDLDTVYVRIMRDVMASLEDAEKSQLFGQGTLSERLKRLDADSLLKTLLTYADNDEAVRLIGKVTVLDDYWQCSTLLFIREELDGAFNKLDEIVGGMDRLPNALADAPLPDGTTLRSHIEFCTEIFAIEQTNTGITIKSQQKGEETFSYVLCTIPFSVLRRMDIQIWGSKKIKDAIQGLSYQSSTKVLLNCTKRFWESNYQIYGGASLSDSIARMTFYPSDNSEQQNPEISQEPGVLLGSYTWGATARRLGVLPPDERGELVVDKIARFHPEIKDYLDAEEPYASMAWDQYSFAAGAFSSPSPNDVQIFFPGVSQPAGRLFFAGEHLSPYPSWIQGALWSALQAVMQIVLA